MTVIYVFARQENKEKKGEEREKWENSMIC